MFFIRFKAAIAFIIFASIFLCGLIFSLHETIRYFTYPNHFVFSWLSFFAIVFSFVFLAISMAPGHIAIFGRPMCDNVLKKISTSTVLILCLSLLVGILGSFVYSSHIKSKGYIACKGVPSGWMPGMATKYAINKSLCHK
jgi:uncharacterized membrane protein YcgQ (UPF0703/DUF1980 family)